MEERRRKDVRMNVVILNGRLFTLPKISFLQITDSRSIMACKFVISVKEQKMQFGPVGEENTDVERNIDGRHMITDDPVNIMVTHIRKSNIIPLKEGQPRIIVLKI